MADEPTSSATPGPARSTSSAGRTVALVIGIVLAILGVLVALSGAALLAAQAAFDDDGFVTTRTERLQSNVVAITSETFDVEDVDEWPFDDDPLQLRVTVEGTDQPVLVGIAPADELRAALDQTSRAAVAFDDGPWGGPSYDVMEGSDSAPTDPVDLVDWDTYAVGSGVQQLTWDLADGEWAIALLNADGSSGLDADARVGIALPFAQAVGWVVVGTGIAIGLVAALLIVAGSRRARGTDAGSPLATGIAGDAAAEGELPASPLRLEARIDDPGRALWLVKWLLLVPHVVVLAVLWIAVAFVTVFAWFAVVLTARYPKSLFDFVEGVARWTWRVEAYGYGALSTDRYPPFSMRDDPDYPATLHLQRPERLSRLLPFVKWVLLLPHWLVIGAISGGTYVMANGDTATQVSLAGALVLVAGFGLLFTGSLPRGIFDLLLGMNRWGWRVFAYGALLTDEYPPLRLDQGGSDPTARNTAAATPNA